VAHRGYCASVWLRRKGEVYVNWYRTLAIANKALTRMHNQAVWSVTMTNLTVENHIGGD
jgi:hypothetical protein